MAQQRALIIDDEPDIRELLELTLGRMGIETHAAANASQAREQLRQHRFDLCLTDMRLPDGNGIDLVKLIQQQYPQTPVAVITAYGSMESAVDALKAGAFDFVSKPVDLEVLRNLVNTALKLSATPHRDRRSRNELLGDSPAMRNTRSKIAKLARSQAPVYISGESGSGKELVARLIHRKGPRSEKPFVPVNCGAIPTELMESEFFGHKKGSFTGAASDKEGLFQAANGGTLFLDEVAELPLHMQVKLLRAIQEKAVRPVGSQKETPIDVRILSATHKALAQLVKNGSFRQDLYYRINVIELPVPSLRERIEDIPVLAEHILQRIAQQTGDPPARLGADALRALQQYPFPGNVRELENILERAMTLSEGDRIQVEDLQLPEHEGTAVEDEDELPLEDYLGSKEKEVIQQALEKARYNKTAAAKLLGISFRALRYRLKKLGMD
jgi:two-component system response regulator PilR (NtrC family)